MNGANGNIGKQLSSSDEKCVLLRSTVKIVWSNNKQTGRQKKVKKTTTTTRKLKTGSKTIAYTSFNINNDFGYGQQFIEIRVNMFIGVCGEGV